MKKLRYYQRRVRRFDEKRFYKEYTKVSRKIEKYQRKIKELRGEEGMGLIRFLWRNHKREERLENRICRRLKRQENKFNILKEESEKLNYNIQKYFTSPQFPFSRNYFLP